MKNRRSEVATLFMVGTLVVLGVSAVMSVFTSNQKRTTSSRANSYTCVTNGNDCVPKDGSTLLNAAYCIEMGYPGGGTGSCASAAYACCKKKVSVKSDGGLTPKSTNTPTPPPASGKGCGSGGGWACDSSKGYDPVSCPTKNLEFRCCVQRSNGDLAVYGCGGTHCSAIKLAGITACSTLDGYGAGAPGSIIAKKGQDTPVDPPPSSGGGGPIDASCKAGSGNKFACDPATGYNKGVCEAPNLEFACCVQDSRCGDGEARYRWYGCTGQPCQNTKIKNAIGHLVPCPYGVNKSNPESCETQLTPEPTPVSQGNNSCIESVTTDAECKQVARISAQSYLFDNNTKQCCLTTPQLEPPAPGCVQLGSECDIACGSVYPNGATCTNGFCCPKTKPDDGANNTCSKNLKCKDISAQFAAKSYSKKGDVYYTTSNCSGATSTLEGVYAHCAQSFKTPDDNQCIEIHGPGAYCPNLNLPIGNDFEKTETPCGLGRYCVKKKDVSNYLQVRCSSIDPSYSPNYFVYQKDGQYFKKQGTSYIVYGKNELEVYCSQQMGAIYDNSCKRKLNDPTAECPLIGQKGSNYTTTNERCGPAWLRFCVVKKKTNENLGGSPKDNKKQEGIIEREQTIECAQVVDAGGRRYCVLPSGEYLDLGPITQAKL